MWGCNKYLPTLKYGKTRKYIIKNKLTMNLIFSQEKEKENDDDDDDADVDDDDDDDKALHLDVKVRPVWKV